MAKDQEDEISLDDVFEDVKPEAKADPPAVEASEVVEEEVTAAETAEGAAEEIAEAVAETTAETTTARTGQLAALLAERDKRQKLQEKLSEASERLKQYEDVEDEAPKVSVEQELLQNKIELSRDVMSELDENFEKTYEPYFMGMVMDEEGNVTDERLLAEFQNSRNPAKFARDTAKKDIRVQEVNDPNYEKKQREIMRAELLKEIKEAGVSAVDVPDLTTTADSGSNSTPVVKDDKVEDMEFAIDK